MPAARPVPGATGSDELPTVRLPGHFEHFYLEEYPGVVKLVYALSGSRMGAGFGSIWVANQTSQSVSRIDARTGQPQATIPVTGHVSADDLAVDAGSVWVRSGARLWRLDPATNTMADRTGDWEVRNGFAVVDDLLWLSGTTPYGNR